jgi:hypothetical protein
MNVEELSPLLETSITAADRQSARSVAARWGASPSGQDPGPLGRLGRLLTWWASVRGEQWVVPPESVMLCRAPDPPDRPGPDPALFTDRITATVGTATVPEHLDVVAAARWGAEHGDAWADEGIDLLLLSLGDPVPARVLAAHLLAVDTMTASGRPRDSGIDDVTWMRRTAQIRDGLHRLRNTSRRPATVLAALADPTVAAAVTLLLRCSARRTPVLLDGPGAATVALLARTASPAAATWWLAAHRSRHPLHTRVIEAAQLDPVLDLEIGPEDGTGVLAALTLVEFALQLPSVHDDTVDQPERTDTP